jgi:hypothetical protein
MASPAVAQALSVRTYEAFYAAAHEYSEALLGPLASIAAHGDLISRLIPRLEQPHAVPANVLPACQNLMALSPVTTDEIRRFFWPHYEDRPDLDREDAVRLRHEALRVRWQPYDVDTWDRCVDELRAMLANRIESLDQNHRILEEWIATADSESSTTADQITGLVARLPWVIGRLQRLLERDGFPIDG